MSDGQAISDLMEGYRRFRNGTWPDQASALQTLVAEGQQPKVAMVACADSRIDPAQEFQAGPGEIFMIRNVANLVPPMEESGTYHGTSAALEFAVKELGVGHIIVLGHAHCGGVKAVMDPVAIEQKGYLFVASWVSMLTAAARRVVATMPDATPEERQRACEQHSVLVSLENLTTFPWIAEKIAQKTLRLHGWYFDIGAGELSVYDSALNRFEQVDIDAG
ncbi:MAG: carbonic anhydrase [Rhodospirillales bacterium]